MLRIARARVPEATFHAASLTRATIPPCDAVVAIGEVVSYVPTSLGAFFRRVHDALEPGGVFIFDFMESAERRTYAARIFGGSDWHMILRADLDAAGRTLTRRLTMFRKVGKEYRRSRETHRVTLRSRQDVRKMLVSAGFTVKMRCSYGGYRLLPGDVTVVARR